MAYVMKHAEGVLKIKCYNFINRDQEGDLMVNPVMPSCAYCGLPGIFFLDSHASCPVFFSDVRFTA